MNIYQKRKERKEKRENNSEEKVISSTGINWYPGHMVKAKREIKERIKLIDIIYECVDARMPSSSKLKGMDDILEAKPRILVMTKKDLCDLEETNKWIKHYEEKGYKVILLDLTNNDDYIYDRLFLVAKDNSTSTNKVINAILEKYINEPKEINHLSEIDNKLQMIYNQLDRISKRQYKHFKLSQQHFANFGYLSNADIKEDKCLNDILNNKDNFNE